MHNWGSLRQVSSPSSTPACMEAAAELSCASKAGHKALPMWISCHSSVTVFVKSLLLSSANQHFAGILFYFGTCFTINSVSNKITREKSVRCSI